MKRLPRIVGLYVLAVTFTALVLWAGSIFLGGSWRVDWVAFLFLVISASTAQYFTVVTPRHQRYYLTPAFYFAGIVLLDPPVVLLLVLVSHLPEWIAAKYPWYIQAFNIASHSLAVFVSKAVFAWAVAATGQGALTPYGLLLLLGTAAAYMAVRHIIVDTALLLTRNVGLRGSEVLSMSNFLTDLALACVGATLAVLWLVQPWLVFLGLAPLILMHRALSVPALKEEAQVDSKTGLYNSRYFDGSIADELRRARRFARPLAVMMADLDGLRHINNTYGHLAGDAVLGVVGKIIREQVREYDVAARFGGEEFALLMPESGSREGYLVAERIRKAVESTPVHVPTQEQPIRVTITAGVSSYPADGHEAERLLHAADVALYLGKMDGKNRVRMAGPIDLDPQADPGPAAPRSSGASSDRRIGRRLVDAAEERLVKGRRRRASVPPNDEGAERS